MPSPSVSVVRRQTVPGNGWEMAIVRSPPPPAIPARLVGDNAADLGGGGASGSDPDTNPPPPPSTIWDLLGGVPRGMGLGAGVPGTPTYIPQNDTLVALILLNTRMWRLFVHSPSPGSHIWGTGLGRSGVKKTFMFSVHLYIPHEFLSILSTHTWGPKTIPPPYAQKKMLQRLGRQVGAKCGPDLLNVVAIPKWGGGGVRSVSGSGCPPWTDPTESRPEKSRSETSTPSKISVAMSARPLRFGFGGASQRPSTSALSTAPPYQPQAPPQAFTALLTTPPRVRWNGPPSRTRCWFAYRTRTVADHVCMLGQACPAFSCHFSVSHPVTLHASFSMPLCGCPLLPVVPL